MDELGSEIKESSINSRKMGYYNVYDSRKQVFSHGSRSHSFEFIPI
jgi:hypothetical protein